MGRRRLGSLSLQLRLDYQVYAYTPALAAQPWLVLEQLGADS